MNHVGNNLVIESFWLIIQIKFIMVYRINHGSAFGSPGPAWPGETKPVWTEKVEPKPGPIGLRPV